MTTRCIRKRSVYRYDFGFNSDTYSLDMLNQPHVYGNDHDDSTRVRMTHYHISTSNNTCFTTRRALNACDGLVVSAPACFEPKESLDGLDEWFGKNGRRVYSVGPLLPRAQHAVAQEKTLSADSSKIDDFMEKALETSGLKSMIFVRFLLPQCIRGSESYVD